MKQRTYSNPRSKFSQKTSVSNVNVSNDNFVCLKLAPRIRGKSQFIKSQFIGLHSKLYL